MSGHAFCRLTALAGILARLEEFARSPDPECIDAALFDAATVCREAEVLLRSIDSCQKSRAQVVAHRGTPARSMALLGGGVASGG